MHARVPCEAVKEREEEEEKRGGDRVGVECLLWDISRGMLGYNRCLFEHTVKRVNSSHKEQRRGG